MSEPIAACVTAWGHAAIAVVRVSGSALPAVLEPVCGSMPRPWTVARCTFRDAAGTFDDGLVSWFPAPRSYTGEDVAELSCHGNPLLVERLLAALGVRLARPGEFTRRAFLNGKLDLTAAEAVLQAIEATSRAGLDLARAGLEGHISDTIRGHKDALVEIASELEAILDYPGEDLLFDDDDALRGRLGDVHAALTTLAASYRAGRLTVEGARVALIGPPNAGKSSLFNALLGRERALVSPVPGTTRDYVEAVLQMDALRITLVDTAGDRDATEPIEAAGIALGRSAASDADLVLGCAPIHDPRPPPKADLVVGTFADLSPLRPCAICVSARTGEGLDALRDAIRARLIGEEPGAVRDMLASARQRDVVLEAAAHVAAAVEALGDAGPAVCVERVYAALESLSAVSGDGVRESVLDRLFARFCIGK